MSINLENTSIEAENLYEQDYYLWLETLANQIQSGNVDANESPFTIEYTVNSDWLPE